MPEPDPTPTPAPEPQPTPTPAPPDPTPPAFAAITSQEEFDRRIQERIARVKSAPPADYEELQEKAKRLAALEDANATELEKAQKRAEDAEKVAAEATATAKATALRAAIIAEAAKPERKIADVEATFGFLTGLDSDLVELGGDGNPIDIAKAVDSLLERRPILVSQNGGARPGGADQGARGGGGEQLLDLAAFKSLSPEKQRDAIKDGKVDLAGAGGKTA